MKLSVIIPCYNESKDIAEKSKIVFDYLTNLGIDFEIIAVDDGSKDNTKEVIYSLPYLRATSYKENMGKGGAVKSGIELAHGDYILFMDADLSTDLSAIDTMLPFMEEYDFIIGSRHHKESKILVKQPFKRRFIGWCCRRLVNMRFHFHMSDTQCGFKAIRASVAKEMVLHQIIYGFAFDVEYLYIAKLNNIKVKEIPVIWRDDRGSTVKSGSSMAFMKDMTKMKKNKKFYIF